MSASTEQQQPGAHQERHPTSNGGTKKQGRTGQKKKQARAAPGKKQAAPNAPAPKLAGAQPQPAGYRLPKTITQPVAVGSAGIGSAYEALRADFLQSIYAAGIVLTDDQCATMVSDFASGLKKAQTWIGAKAA
jgi:hypothetical protein